MTGGDEPVYSGTSGFRGLVPAELLPRLPDPGALQFWMGPGAHLLHYPVDGGRVINFLAVIDGPRRWTAPAWMEAGRARRAPGGVRGLAPGRHRDDRRRAPVAALGPVRPAAAGPLEPRPRGAARRRGPRHAAPPGSGRQPDDRGRRRAGVRTGRRRRCAHRAIPLRGPAPGADAPGPAAVLGGVRRAAPARRPGRTTPRRGAGSPAGRPGLDSRLRRAGVRYPAGVRDARRRRDNRAGRQRRGGRRRHGRAGRKHRGGRRRERPSRRAASSWAAAGRPSSTAP